MKPEQIVIREAELQDLQTLARMYLEHIRHQDLLDEHSSPNPIFDSEVFIKNELLQGFYQYFLVEQDGKPAGFVRLVIQQSSRALPIRPSQDSLLNKMSLWRVINKFINLVSGYVNKKLPATPVSGPQLYGYLADIYVVPEQRNKGLGKALVERAMQWFKQNKVDLLFLQVLENNQQGKQFWEKMKFRPSKHIMVKKN